LRGFGFGKLYVIEPGFSIDFGGLGATFLSHYFRHLKRFLLGQRGSKTLMGQE
jgi:hypothetical protein